MIAAAVAMETLEVTDVASETLEVSELTAPLSNDTTAIQATVLQETALETTRDREASELQRPEELQEAVVKATGEIVEGQDDTVPLLREVAMVKEEATLAPEMTEVRKKKIVPSVQGKEVEREVQKVTAIKMERADITSIVVGTPAVNVEVTVDAAQATKASHLDRMIPKLDSLSAAIVSSVAQDRSGMVRESTRAADVASLIETRSGWVTKLQGEIRVTCGQDQQHEAVLKLSPPELGSMKVTIRESHGIVQLVMVVESQDAKQAVEREMRQLEQMLSNDHLKLASAQVDVGGTPYREDAEQADGADEAPALRGVEEDEEGKSTIAFSVNIAAHRGMLDVKI